MSELIRGPVHTGDIPLRPGLGDGGVDTLRRIVRGRGRHNGSLSLMGRDCHVGLEMLQQFAFGHTDLTVLQLQAIARYVYSDFKTYDPTVDAIVTVERPKVETQIERCSREMGEWFRNKPQRPPPAMTVTERASKEAAKMFLENQRSKRS